MPNLFDHLDELEADEKMTRVIENRPLLQEQMKSLCDEYGSNDSDDSDSNKNSNLYENIEEYTRNSKGNTQPFQYDSNKISFKTSRRFSEKTKVSSF